MKLVTLSVAVAAACLFVQTAQARGYHHHRYGSRHHASRQVLSQRYLEQSGYRSAERSARQNWNQDWNHDWVQDWNQGSKKGSNQGRAGRDEDLRYSERRRSFRRHRSERYAERGEGRGDYSRFAEHADYHGGYGARPAAWCGWEMRHLVGGDPGPQFNLARNWAHWGHAGPAGVGAVVVWSHHVGKIVGRDGDGQWVIQSGNDGHRVRTRPRSIGGAIAIRWG